MNIMGLGFRVSDVGFGVVIYARDSNNVEPNGNSIAK